MCQVSCEELGRGSFLERRQAVSRRGDRLRGVGSTSGPERETDALEKVGAEPGSDGQAGAGEAAEQARVLGPGARAAAGAVRCGGKASERSCPRAGVPVTAVGPRGLTRENACSEQRLFRKKGKSGVCFDRCIQAKGFPTLALTVGCGWLPLCVGRPGHCRAPSGSPGLHPADTVMPPAPRGDSHTSADVAECPLGAQLPWAGSMGVWALRRFQV